MNFRSELAGEREGFQLAPLIDIVFLLLVFFVVTSALQQFERELHVNVPTASKGEAPKHTSPPYYVNITRDGTYIISNQAYTYDQLRTLLVDLKKAYGASPLSIVIRADRAAACQYLVNVIDACIDAEIFNFAIANVEDRPRGK